MSDVDCGHWAEAETTTAPLPAVCRHCDVAVVAVSVGYVHADTHNTHGADGHRAELHIPGNVVYIDEWAPAEDVANPPHPPVRLADIAWDRMSPAERDNHRQNCEGCALCVDHRVFGWCKYEGTETEVMDDGNCTCGSPILMGTDYSDVKVSER